MHGMATRARTTSTRVRRGQRSTVRPSVGGLENRCGGNLTVGSNPTLSARWVGCRPCAVLLGDLPPRRHLVFLRVHPSVPLPVTSESRSTSRAARNFSRAARKWRTCGCLSWASNAAWSRYSS